MKYHEFTRVWKDHLLKGLQEDGFQWDWTALGSLGDHLAVLTQAKVIAKEKGIWVGEGFLQAVADLSKTLNQPIQVKALVKDGERVEAGQSVCLWTGPAKTILAFERPFLNLTSYCSGIATQTAKFVGVIQKHSEPSSQPRLTATRKTLPGYRDLVVFSVIAGGGFSHRLGLSSGVLIKENHIAAAGGIGKAIQGVKEMAPHGLKIEVEVRDLEELKEAVQTGAEGVLLDNFTPDEVRSALEWLKKDGKNVFVEVSGGLNLQTISQFVIPGVDILSVGSLTHSVKALDLSLLIEA
jgi:nicotinate-nucleotide pyrophosphorylase (carboxylating)